MVNNKLETFEDLKTFQDKNNSELIELKCKKENLWRRYKRAKTNDKKQEIYNEIQELEPRIKELTKFKSYCSDIKKRSISIQNNINEIDNIKEIDKTKDNVRI